MSLVLRNLTKRFGDKIILENANLAFSDTGAYHIIGESGIGKTTLLNMIAGLDTDYEGEIFGGGKECVSYVFQEYRLFDTASALENSLISFKSPTDTDIERAKEYFRRLGFTDAEMHLKTRQLSGGMKQRVAIVRALMKDSPIYLFDEPTKELHSELIIKFYRILDELKNDKLILLVSHENVPETFKKIDVFSNNK